MKNHWLILWSLWASRLVRQPTPPVRVEGGWLRGFVAPAGSCKSYLGVPYASHPGKRFQTPEPATSWRGIFEAIEDNIKCIQRIGSSIVIGQEDCLILNVHTPMDAIAASKYPVMVFIHGGGFYDGSSTTMIYGPDYLVAKGIILVTINYRLNIQGFACLRIKEAPGNAGLKDQVAALKWIRRNIKGFGGDPDNVTIFGESAGAASVSFHVLSPMSKGLFNKAIMQSGSSLSSWALQFKPVFMASLLTKVMGYATEKSYEIYDILMKKSDAELIVTRVPRKNGSVLISELLYSPCVEVKLDGEESFLTDLPYNLLVKGDYNKVPMMIGACSQEGLFFALLENSTTIPKIDVNKSLPKNLHIPTEQEMKEVTDELNKIYFDNEEISQNNLRNIAMFEGEVYITHAILEEIELYVKTNPKPVYSYVFNYEGRRNLIKKLMARNKVKAEPGATHAEDILYLFQQTWLPALFEEEMINKVTTLWANFAKYGDPTPLVSDLLPVKWLPVNTSSPQTFIIDREFSTSPLWPKDSLKYLHKVYSKYRRKKD